MAIPPRWGPSRLTAVIMRKTRTALQLLRKDRRGFLAAFITVQRYVVYSADPSRVPPPEPLPGAVLTPLTEVMLAALPGDREEIANQYERIRRRGFLHAYAVLIDGVVAHISWLITAEMEKGYPIRIVKLRPGEVEITHCVTLPEYRGRGVYPFAIRALCLREMEEGRTRIFMVTNILNKASQRGIEKAGLTYRGRVNRFMSPLIQRDGCAISLRGHRWGWPL